MKKTLSLILALLMSVSCAVTIFADDTTATTTAAIAEDATTETAAEEAVDADEPTEPATPYDRAIRFLEAYNIMHGKEDGLAHAEDAVKRYEMALFEGRITTGWVKDDTWEDFQANDSGFADLAGTAAEKVYGAMSYVSQKGIIEGYPDGTFKPEQTVTYREALTMTVRALGYTGLEYPWGYIEEAVKRGLTDGIEGVAYTDPCNRGVAAQIIYNALFADNSKLGLANFDRAFGWADILVTSTVINDTAVDVNGKNTNSQYTSASYVTPANYVAFQIIEKDGTLSKEIYYAPSAVFGFKDAHDDELALGTPYCALFEIDSKNNLVEFAYDEDAAGNKTYFIDKYEATTVKNEGRTDNAGVKIDNYDKITAYMKDYTLVDKYNSKILTNAGKLSNEIIVNELATKRTVTTYDYNKTPYAFDWTTGNILVAANKDGAAGDIKGDYAVYTASDEDVKDGKAEAGQYKSYVVKYFYNNDYDFYYNVINNNYAYTDTTTGYPLVDASLSTADTITLADGTTKINVAKLGINILDQDDVTAMKAAIEKACQKEGTVDDIRYITADIGTDVYATLTTYDLDGNGYADRGNYESYTLGYISQTTGDKAVKCEKCGKYIDSVAISGSNLGILDSKDCGGDKHLDGVWWQDEYAPVLDKDGKIVPAYVIYGYNDTTKELKVIKTVEKYSDTIKDADTYYATGVLRGFSVSKGYVVIGEQTYDFNKDFGIFSAVKNNDKKTTEYKSANGKTVVTLDYAANGYYEAALTSLLDGMFCEFVTYYVVDGEIVDINITGADSKNYIVVQSYAGVSSDGYIVVNGYSTKDLKLQQYRIGSYNGWDNGDFFWYGADRESLSRGCVYSITSYDKDQDVYYVDALLAQNVAEVKYDATTGKAISYEVVREMEVPDKTENATIEITSGYRTYQVTGATSLKSTKKVADTDKYIIVGNPMAVKNNLSGWMPIGVYEGKAIDGWFITGDMLVGSDNGGTFIIINADLSIPTTTTTKGTYNGFNLDNWANGGIVMVVDSVRVSDKIYDGSLTGDWYLLGATNYEGVLVFNFLTGNFDYATSTTNIAPVVGRVYTTVDNIITSEIVSDVGTESGMTISHGATWNTVLTNLTDAYTGAQTTHDYIFSTVTVDAKYFEGYYSTSSDPAKDVRQAFSDGFMKTKLGISSSLKVTDLVNSFKMIELETQDLTGIITDISTYTYKEWLKHVAKDTKATVVADVIATLRSDGTYDVVCYIDPNDAVYTVTTKDVTVDSSNYLELSVGSDNKMNAALSANVNATKKETMEGSTVDDVEYTINSIGLEFIGAAVESENHSKIAMEGYCFDKDQRCPTVVGESTVFANMWDMTIKVATKDASGNLTWTNATTTDEYGQLIAYELYDYESKDLTCNGCDLIRAIDAAVSGLTVTSANTQQNAVYVQVNAKFGTNCGTDGTNDETKLTLAIYVDTTGKLVVKFANRTDITQVLSGVGFEIKTTSTTETFTAKEQNEN